MTKAAREVLADCRLALDLLEAEADFQKWRVHWAAAVALIRAVGHVLTKVDGKDAVTCEVAQAAYKRWKSDVPEHQIFREFIELERNNILKEYRFNLHPMAEVPVAYEIRTRAEEGGEVITVARDIAMLGQNIYRPLLDSYREGDDARDVLAEAIEWWLTELDAIDEKVRRHEV